MKTNKTREDKRNALEKFLGYTPTPLQVTSLYKLWLSKLKKLEREGPSESNVYYASDRRELIKKIDDLLLAAEEVYG